MTVFTYNVLFSAIFLFLGVSISFGYQPKPPQSKVPTQSPPDNTRRSTLLAFPAIAMLSGISLFPSSSKALDMDSFIAKELDTKKDAPIKTMSEDEALCRFGSPSKLTGNACLRAGVSTKRRGGVDAFGTIDRGDFVICKPKYEDDPQKKGQLKNVWDCK